MDIAYHEYRDGLVELRTPVRLRAQQGGLRTFRGTLSKGGKSITIFTSVDIGVGPDRRARLRKLITGAPSDMSRGGCDSKVVRRGECAFGEGGLEWLAVGRNPSGLRGYSWYACFVLHGCDVLWDIKCVEGAPASMEFEEFEAIGRTIVESIHVLSDPPVEKKPKLSDDESVRPDEIGGHSAFESGTVDDLIRTVSRMTGKKSRAASGSSTDDILSQLDQCATALRFPTLDNGYLYLADVRLSAYRDEKRWAVIIETLGHNARASGTQSFSNSLYCFGNCLKGKPGLDNDSWVYPMSDGPDGPLLDEANSLNEGAKSLRIREAVVRINRETAFLVGKKIGRKFDIENWRAHALRQKEPVRKNLLDAAQRMAESPVDADFAGRDLLRSLLPEYRAGLLATDGELEKHLKAKVPLVLRLDEWHHPDVSAGELPSNSEAFKMIAEVLATGDASRYKPTQEPNTHWSNWPMGGDL